MRTPLDAATREANTTSAWLRLHHFDLVLLVLGTFVTLRFWFVVFGVQNRLFMRTVGVLAMCEIAKRAIIASRRWERPRLFSANRRFDLAAALALATTPWPITLPLNAAAPLWSMVPAFMLAGWVPPMVGVLIVAGGIRQLLSRRPEIPLG